MQTLQISLPDDIVSRLKSLKQEQSSFVAEAVQEKFARQKRHSLELALIEGYAASRTEDRIITEDFDDTVGDGL